MDLPTKPPPSSSSFNLSDPPTATSALQRAIERRVPGFSFLQGFFSQWLNVDLTTFAFCLGLFGGCISGINSLRSWTFQLYRWVTRFFTSSVSIPGSDRLNQDVINWVMGCVLQRQETRVLAAQTEPMVEQHQGSWEWELSPYGGMHRVAHPVRRTGTRNPPHIKYLPSFLSTWFVYKKRIFMVRRIAMRGGQMYPASGGGGSPTLGEDPDQYVQPPSGTEPLIVMCLGRSVEPIKEFLEHCRQTAARKRESYVLVRSVRDSHARYAWDTSILRPMRALETVHMDRKVREELVADIKNYLSPTTRRFYSNRGIPYRRGYLLHGRPGTGKTSLSLALASQFELPLYILHIPSVGADSYLHSLFATLPQKCIVLLEDIDAVGMKRTVQDDESPSSDASDMEEQGEFLLKDLAATRKGRKKLVPRSKITLSGLLNCLDGVTSQEGRIVLMTSNIADRLDEALIRPGRIDKIILLHNVKREVAVDMFLRMYTPETDELEEDGADAESDGDTDSENGKDGIMSASTAEKLLDQELRQPVNGLVNGNATHVLRMQANRFADQIPDNVFTPAQLQGFFLGHQGQPEAAVIGIKEWVEREEAAIKSNPALSSLFQSQVNQVKEAR